MCFHSLTEHIKDQVGPARTKDKNDSLQYSAIQIMSN